jgi:hypothetical protein
MQQEPTKTSSTPNSDIAAHSAAHGAQPHHSAGTVVEPLYGLLTDFSSPEALIEAARRTYAAGYRKFDAYTPFPIEGLDEAIGFRRSRIPLVVLAGGILGGCAGFLMLSYSAVIDYPLNIGGRPLFSWPMFIPITFEMTILGAALFAVLGMLALNGLPTPYHPLFNSKRFALASHDRFFLCIEARDPKFDLVQTGAFMGGLSQHPVESVST